MAEDKKISQLNPASAFTGAEKFEVVQGGLNVAGTPEQMKDYIGGLTRESERAYSSELLFDKNEIEGTLHTQTADITFTVAESGNVDTGWSVYGQRIALDGVNPVYFVGFNHVANIASGDILEAGTYQFIFWYSNGIARASIMLPRQETVLLTPLGAPTDFAIVPGAGDPETEIDATWTAIPNATNMVIELSEEGGDGPWVLPITLAGSATSYTRTGLNPNTTYHQRIRAIGDLITFSNSQYVVDATTTQDAGDVTAPTFIFLPADAATNIPINRQVIITCSEAIRDADGTTEITSANITDYLLVKEDNVSGANIPYTATIDITKTIITITPNVVYPSLGDVFVQISGVEDSNGNESVTDDATFTTSDYTEMNNNKLNFGTQINSVVTGNDVNFEIEAEYGSLTLGINDIFCSKYDAYQNQVSFIFKKTVDDGISFKFYYRVSGSSFSSREIIWAGALTGFTSGKITLKYFGAIDTNNGLDRAELYIDDVLISAGKSLVTFGGTTWPFEISVTTSEVWFQGPSIREAKNLIIRNNMGATTIVNVPVIRTGVDTSGNSFDGTWE